MLTTLFLFVVVALLAYANGANDNFKGVATLYGSKAATYRTALAIATLAMLAGALLSVWFSQSLVVAFSGRGLVPTALAETPHFLLAVASGAALTIMFATRFGFPVSTTHALIGALTGAALVGPGAGVDANVLAQTFFLPLLLSPILAVCLTMPLYPALSHVARRFGISKARCVCVGTPAEMPATASNALVQASPVLIVDKASRCEQDGLPGLSVSKLMNIAHYTSASAVCFARALNDTPKIVGLLLVVKALDVEISMVLIGLAMAAGGLLHSQRVAHTMSHNISRMNDGQALTANLVTACLVIFASRLGLPVSTTHVSVGAITGIGIANGSAQVRVIGSIAASWVFTLPIAATLSVAVFAGLTALRA